MFDFSGGEYHTLSGWDKKTLLSEGMDVKKLACACAVVLMGQGLAVASSAGFWGLGRLSEADTYIKSTAISGDGSTVVGISMQWAGALGGRIFKWTLEDGMTAVPDSANGWPLAISHDGSVIVGTGGTRQIYVPLGRGSFIWANGSKTTILPTTALSAATGLTPDGTFVVGASGAPGNNGWTWQGGGPAGLTGLSAAMGISADGTVIAGNRTVPGPNGLNSTEACLWQEGLITGLGTLTPDRDDRFSGTNAMSADGKVVVGRSLSSTMDIEAFRWSQETGMIALGGPPGWSGRNIQSSAWDVSADGSVVVGGAVDFSNPIREQALIWDASHGTRVLYDVLVDDYGLDLAGWRLLDANAISDDGLTITGYGIAPDGRRQPWVVQLPEPSTATLGLLALAPGFLRRGTARPARA